MTESVKWVSTVAVHVSLILGVVAYTIFGALVMRFLEAPDEPSSRIRRQGDPDVFTRVYLGSEMSAMDPHVHQCLEKAVERFLLNTECDEDLIENAGIDLIDDCYRDAEVPPTGLTEVPANALRKKQRPKKLSIDDEVAMEMEKWSFGNALIFTFSVITTIGYGHIAPETFYGRLFVIFFGLVGVPLTLLTVADLGMFFSILLRKLVGKIFLLSDLCKRKQSKIQVPTSPRNNGVLATARDMKSPEDEEEEEESSAQDESQRKTAEAIALSVTFVGYLMLGAKVLSVYEPEMDFFKALYFNFVTLTTIGLGDFVPQSFDYLFITFCYTGIGLALTTMAIEMAADLLRKVHYVGRKMDDMANAVVWFGGTKMTMKKLIKNLGDQFNVPEEELAKFDLNQFVDNAMKVEAGEIKTLRKPPSVMQGALTYSKLRDSSENDILFVDERLGKYYDGPADSVRTMETLPLNDDKDGIDFEIPPLDLEYPFFSDSSMPTSFDDDYLRTLETQRKQRNARL